MSKGIGISLRIEPICIFRFIIFVSIKINFNKIEVSQRNAELLPPLSFKKQLTGKQSPLNIYRLYEIVC